MFIIDRIEGRAEEGLAAHWRGAAIGRNRVKGGAEARGIFRGLSTSKGGVVVYLHTYIHTCVSTYMCEHICMWHTCTHGTEAQVCRCACGMCSHTVCMDVPSICVLCVCMCVCVFALECACTRVSLCGE